MSDTPSERKPITDIIYFDFDDEELDAAADANLTPYDNITDEDTYYDDEDYETPPSPEHIDDADFQAHSENTVPSQSPNAASYPGQNPIDTSDAAESLYLENLEKDTRESDTKRGQKKKRKRPARRGDHIDPIETKDGIIDVERRKHPRTPKNREDDLSHPDYTISVTKGLTNTLVKRYYFSYARYHLTRIFMFLLFVGFITYIAFSATSMVTAFATRQGLMNQITELTKENNDLSSQCAIAEAKVTQLSQAMNATIASSQTEAAKYEDSLLPSGFPLSRFAPMEITFEGADHVLAVANEDTEDDTGETGDDNAAAAEDQTDGNAADTTTDQASEDASNGDTSDTGEGSTVSAMDGIEDTPSGYPIALFACQEGTFVTASGGGVVTRITTDEIFGTLLTIDHRNGYITFYRNKGEALVRVGDTIERGDSLFEIIEGNLSFGYQIKLNDSYINPASMMEING